MGSGRSPILARVSEAEPLPTPGKPRRRLAWSTAVFAAITGVSRVLGLGREIVVRRAFGVEGESTHSRSPSRSRTSCGPSPPDAALGAAFVPVFSELLEQEQRARLAGRFDLFWLVLIVLGALTGLLARERGRNLRARGHTPPPTRQARRQRDRVLVRAHRRGGGRRRGGGLRVWYGLDETLGRSLGAQLLSVGIGNLAGAAVYLACAALLRVRELQMLLSLRRGSATTDSEQP